MSPARVAFGTRLFVLGLLLAHSSFPGHAQQPNTQSESQIAEQDRDQPRHREQWFMHGRLIPGESGAALRYRAHGQKIQLRSEQTSRMNAGIAAASTTAIGIWTALGPAPLASDATGLGQQDYGWVSGRATAVAVDPADATGNTVYIGGAYGGVWKSTNAGPLSPNPASVSWSPLIDNQATLAVGSIAIQPGNADPTKSVILLGTGETNSSMDSYYGLGILRSADAGNTWTLITQDSSGTHPFAGMGFSKIAFSTANPGLVVAAAAGASQGVIDGLETPVNTNRGILLFEQWWRVLELRQHKRRGHGDPAELRDIGDLQRGGGKIFCGNPFSWILFIQRWRELDAARHATRWAEHVCMPDNSGLTGLPDLSRGIRGRARTQ